MLGNKSVLPTPGEQNTAEAEAETWRHSTDLNRFLERFLRGRRRLALTPLSAKPGDEIWILFNGRLAVCSPGD